MGLGRTLGRLAPTTVFEIEVAGAIRFLLMLVCVVLLNLSLTREPDNTVRPHSALGYRPPAPETIIPLDQRPIMH